MRNTSHVCDVPPSSISHDEVEESASKGLRKLSYRCAWVIAQQDNRAPKREVGLRDGVIA